MILQLAEGADSKLPETLLDLISKEVQAAGKVSELIEALEMTELTSGTGGDVRLILARWQREMMGQEIPAYPHLLMHLRGISMEDLHKRYSETCLI